ncbi:MAG: hypothetical protein HY708_08150, partial [Ignavibacteriae bacterium]|nr:hypothetical protein [Ignavibacteriota bacterium]
FGVIRWRQIIHSSLMRQIKEHVPIQSDRHDAIMRVINRSFVVVLVSTIIGLVYVVLGARVFSDAQLMMINLEDGIIEYATALLFLSCSFISAYLAYSFRYRTTHVFSYLVLGVGFFLCFGEEISWGQGLLGLKTIDVMAAYNVQNENNLHNLMGYFADHIFIFSVFVYGCVLPVLKHSFAFFRKLFGFIGIPIPSPGLAVGFLIISMIHSWTVYELVAPMPFLRIAELREFLTAIGFSVLMYESRLLMHGAARAG